MRKLSEIEGGKDRGERTDLVIDCSFVLNNDTKENLG